MNVGYFNKTIQEMLGGASQLEAMERIIAVLTHKHKGKIVVTKEDVEAFLAGGPVTNLMIANTDGNLVLANVEFSGDAPLHGAASAGTKG